MDNIGNGWRALRPDAQAFDRIEIITVPRLKCSGLSGDEWRISAEVIFYRKGKEILREGCRNVETACAFLAYWHAKAVDDGHGYFAGEGDICDQEGCSEKGTIRADLIKRYCNDGHASELHTPEHRLFCERHKYRGDCGLDDADRNYIFSDSKDQSNG